MPVFHHSAAVGKVYLSIADLGETGFEQRGVLLRAFQKVLQEMG